MILEKMKLVRFVIISTPLQKLQSNRSNEIYFFHFYYKK